MSTSLDTQKTIERLQATLGKMEIALSTIIDSIVWTDQQGVIQWCNAPFDRMMNKRHLDILGASLTDFLSLKDHPLFDVLKAEGSYHGEYAWQDGQGIKRDIDMYVSKVSFGGDGVDSIVFVLRDITEQKKADENAKKLLQEMAKASMEKTRTEEMKKAYLASLNIMSDLDREKKKLQGEIEERQRIEARLQQLLVSVEQSPNAIMITDIDGTAQYVNVKFFEMTGYDQAEVLSRPAKIMIKGSLSDEEHQRLWSSLRAGEGWKGEFLNTRKDGASYWEHVIVSPVHDKTGRTTNFLIITQDITERKQAEAQMQAALEMKSEFTSTVSHELRTPLASIKGSIDIIMSKIAGPLTEDQEKFLGKAKSNIDRLKRLIDDFLDLSKLESGRIEMTLQPYDLRIIINDVIDIQRSVATAKGIGLRCELPDQLPQVRCDQDRISQVLVNLVNNAIKFTEEGEVVIKVRALEEGVECAVCDTGEGIDQENIPKLFEKFYQFGDPAKRKQGGTGLGLTICKEIIAQHQGRIWAESIKGKGSCFYFLLPWEERGRDNG